ncbi:Golgi-associated RAB2 interactor protein 4 [Anolis carolinensis]|uniref:Golgi-associated RAB2 interactor protein 4 n=1 Tax=Anolis carolinensis TaxID=28377 RepID=UPI002F2B6A91
MSQSKRSNASVGGIPVRGLFNREMGPLQRQLQQGEYSLLRFAPMLENEFLQINKRGDVADVHNERQTVTIALACTNPNFPGPNVLLLARRVLSPEEQPPKMKTLQNRRAPVKKFELTRLLPLTFVNISVHNAEKEQLRFKLASGRNFYLQLCHQLGVQEDVFKLWVKVINVLQPPSASRLELQGKIKDPGRPGNPPPQKPKPSYVELQSPPGSSSLEVTESIPSVYSPELVSPIQEDTRSSRSVALSMGGPPSFHLPSHSPAAIEEKTSELEMYPLSEGIGSADSLESPLIPSNQDDEKESDAMPTRKTSRGRKPCRKKSSQRATTRKPSKLASLILSCSWGSWKRTRSRDAKKRDKEKKH